MCVIREREKEREKVIPGNLQALRQARTYRRDLFRDGGGVFFLYHIVALVADRDSSILFVVLFVSCPWNGPVSWNSLFSIWATAGLKLSFPFLWQVHLVFTRVPSLHGLVPVFGCFARPISRFCYLDIASSRLCKQNFYGVGVNLPPNAVQQQIHRKINFVFAFVMSKH